MNTTPRMNRTTGRFHQQGQTLVVALIVLALLLILGVAFSGIVGRNITEARTQARRIVATDLGEAGVEYAHYQLVNSALGADWRPSPTRLDVGADGLTRDPDAHYLRPASGLLVPGTSYGDLGGPDGLGPFSRVDFARGRALVRVRYAPGDFTAMTAGLGPLRQPGRAKNYLIIESVGRQGAIETGGRVDPTRAMTQAVKVAGYTDQDDFVESFRRLALVDGQIPSTRKKIGFASIGIIESARFITNKNRVSRPADLGFPIPSGAGEPNVGATYDGQPVSTLTRWGGDYGGGMAAGTGSLFSNADLLLHGRHEVVLNKDMGDQWAVAGSIRPANPASALSVQRWQFNGGWTSTNATLSGNQLDSRNNAFTTFGGVLRDGSEQADAERNVRGVRRKEPPSILAVDPQDKRNRYMLLTRESGADMGGRNSGQHGWGRGVYVDAPERGNTASGDQRVRAGAVRSLPNDWLNPNNGSSVAWEGPFYRPIAPSLRLLPDGFEIVRDSRSRRPSWFNPATGSDTGLSVARYRLRTIDGQAWVLSSIMTPDLVARDGANLANADFEQNGFPFNGVLLFEGDVRTRGVIPTDMQLTVVSMGSIYVEGSITKGLVTEAGQTLTRPSTSALMLMARDYVALNTTMFFAPAPGSDPKTKTTDILPDAPSPLEMDLAESPSLELDAQFVLEPTSANPSTWAPAALGYVSANDNVALTPQLLLTSSADDGGPAFLSLSLTSLSYGGATIRRPYLFDRATAFGFGNGAAPFFTGTGSIPVYGLANTALNAYPRFETVGFPLTSGKAYNGGGRRIDGVGANGDYALAVQDETRFRFELSNAGTGVPKNFLLAKAAIVPHDVRIEAAMFAEEGSFFVIPGPWFNPNAEDTRARYQSDVNALGLQSAQVRRFELYANGPTVPFYGEPLAVRVSIVGAISENMPAAIGHQSEWLRKWGWMPYLMGGTGQAVPTRFLPAGFNASTDRVAPNLAITYDPVLARGTADGTSPVRVDGQGRVLPPMPRLPVSPSLAYFGEVNP